MFIASEAFTFFSVVSNIDCIKNRPCETPHSLTGLPLSVFKVYVKQIFPPKMFSLICSSCSHCDVCTRVPCLVFISYLVQQKRLSDSCSEGNAGNRRGSYGPLELCRIEVERGHTANFPYSWLSVYNKNMLFCSKPIACD